MTSKLKTLKDIQEKIPGDTGWLVNQNIDIDELKEEAIRWIKEKFTWKYTCDDSNDVFEIELMKGKKEEFMEFFNITEGDLKE